MKFTIQNRIIRTEEKALIVGDNCDYVAEFEFDAEWEGLTKTARFIYCDKYVDVVLVDDKCCFPVEVLKCGKVQVGVYSAEKTTSQWSISVTKSIKDETGCECEPTPSVYEQLTKLLDDLYKLMPNEVAAYFEDHKDDFRGEKGEKGDDGSIKFIPVTELPTENIDEAAIYCKPSSDPDEQNKYDEFIYTNGSWEFLGSANVKFEADEYVKKTDYAKTNGTAGVVKAVGGGNGVTITADGILQAEYATESDIKNKTSYRKAITPINLDEAIKVGLTTNTKELTEEQQTAVKNWLGIVTNDNEPVIALTELEDGSYSLDVTTTDTVAEQLDEINGEVI